MPPKKRSAFQEVSMIPNKTNASVTSDLILEELADGLSNDGRMIISIMNKRFLEMKNEFDEMKTEFINIISSKNDEIATLSNDVTNLKHKITRLENTLDEEDAYIRRETIILSGTCVPEVTNGEICSNIVQKLVKDKLRIQLNDNDISVAHRLGKKPVTQGSDKRGIVVKFCRRDTKRQILAEKRNIPKGNPQSTLFINESLTPRRQTILYALRQMKRAHPSIITGCSTFDGRVYAYTKPTSAGPSSAPHRNVRHLINSHESLVAFCVQHVK